jgi:hypothetical protein
VPNARNRKIKKMKNTFITTVVALLIAGSANAAEIAGKMAVDVAENAAGKHVAATTLSFGITAPADVATAFGGFTYKAVNGVVSLDDFQIGVNTEAGSVSFGDQGDLFVGNNFEVVGGDTIANPATYDSVIIESGPVAAMVGLTNIATDISDVSNLQVSYGTPIATTVVDWDKTSKEYTLGAKTSYALNDDLSLGGIVTYAGVTDVVAYEASAGNGLVTAFFNGNEDNKLQHVGLGIAATYSGLGLYVEGEYDTDAKDSALAAGVAFNF